MKLKDWFSGGSPLQLAIERGLKPGANLVAELDALDDYKIKSKGDAAAICKALEALEGGHIESPRRGDSPLYALARLFYRVAGKCAALDFLREHGIPPLLRLARKSHDKRPEKQDELLFVLKILATYGTAEGADFVVEIGTQGYANRDYMWT